MDTSIAGAVTGYLAHSTAVSSLGFTTGGIAAGSTAAAMISAAAIAVAEAMAAAAIISAEAIVAGEGVAISVATLQLQSVGALGMMGGAGPGLVLFGLSAGIAGALGARLAYIVKKYGKEKISNT
jgi:hypothetical protein